jgi:hypothetical protein
MTSRKMLVGLCGRKGSGKDTVAAILSETHGFLQYALAAPLKRVCKQLFDFNDDQLWGEGKDIVDSRFHKTPRELMQKQGTDFVRCEMGEGFWLLKFEGWFASNSLLERVVVSDVRFQNEVDYIKRMGGRMYKVERPQLKDGDMHVSEQADSLVGIDATIVNGSNISSLEAQIEEKIAPRG